jgi:hypothetical protein
MLSGVARCKACGAAIGVARTSRGTVAYPAYTCGFHHQRGPAVCAVAVYEPIQEIEEPLIEYVREKVLARAKLEKFIADVRAEITASQKVAPKSSPARLEKDLAKLRQEQKRYAAAVANAPDVAELRRRQERIRCPSGSFR